MKIGLFFGSFNPIHVGHLIIGEYVASVFTDKVWFVVSPQNPLKKIEGLLNITDRILLINSIIKDNSRFETLDIEVNLPMPSYTINTLNHLNKTYPQHDYFLILGSDNFLTINKWKSYKTLLKNYKFLIYERPLFKLDRSKLPLNVKVLDGPLMDISSTQIRKFIEENISVRYLVPDKVLKLIKKNNLYNSMKHG